jgi:hypothetical protein
MRRVLAITAAALASLWAGAAWSADESGPSDDGTSLTFAPADSALVSQAGVLDPNFRSGTFAAIAAEPPASTIAFRFSNGTVNGSAILEHNFAFDANSPFEQMPAIAMRDVILSAALAPSVDLTVAQGRDLAAIGAFGGGDSPSDSLFLTSAGMRSPYLSLTDGGVYGGLTFHLADNLRLRAGHAALGGEAAAQQGILADAQLRALPRDLALRLANDGRSAATSAIGLDWNFADWGTLGLTASHSSETDALLGVAPISIASPAETAALGVSARVGFGSGWVTTVQYAEGVTQLDLRSAGFAAGAGNTVKARSYGITFAKEGLFGGDTIGLSLTRPLQVYEGDAGLLAGTGVGQVNLAFDSARGLVTGTAPESDIEFGYVTSFLGGSLALQANAAYQVNANGQRGENAVSVVSRAKINF